MLRHENLLFLWYFCEFQNIRCVWPKLDNFLYDINGNLLHRNDEKKEKQNDFKHVVAAMLVLS